jgi:hypothetical protein
VVTWIEDLFKWGTRRNPDRLTWGLDDDPDGVARRVTGGMVVIT